MDRPAAPPSTPVTSSGLPLAGYPPVSPHPAHQDRTIPESDNGTTNSALTEDSKTARRTPSNATEETFASGQEQFSFNINKLQMKNGQDVDVNRTHSEFNAMADKATIDDIATLSLFDKRKQTTGKECGMCQQDVNAELKLLPCFHSFCLDCLEKHINHHSSRAWLKCPLCKKRNDIPKGGPKNYEDNVFVRLSDTSEKEPRCEICGDKIPACTCTDCGEDFCSDCTRLHLKMETTKNHTILQMTLNEENRTAEQPQEKYCSSHSDQRLQYYCVTCSELVCAKCSVTKHSRHVFSEIEAAAREMREELTSLISESHSRRLVRDLEDNVSTSLTDSIRLKDNVESTVVAIQTHIKKLKDDLDIVGQKLIDDLRSKQEVWESVYHRKVKDAESKRGSTEALLLTTKQIIEGSRDIEIVQKYRSLKSIILDLKKSCKPPTSQNVRVKFIPLAKTSTCGRVRIKASLKKNLEFYLRTTIEFHKQINSICPTADGKAWVAYRRFIELCTKDGVHSTKIDLGEPAYGIAENSNGTIYTACKTCVKVITNKMSAKKCFHLPHEPSSIAFNEEDEFIICFREARKVSIYTLKGKHLKDVDLRNLGFRFGARVTDPWKVAVNENQDICVTDYSSENVAVYDGHGEIKTVFRCKVMRYAIVCCNEGYIYIADYKKDSVSVFSEDGQLLQGSVTAGIPGPMSIAVDKTGDLWLGSWTGRVLVYGRR